MQDLARVQVHLVGDLGRDLHEEPAVDVEDAFRRAGRAARVADEQRVLALERLGRRAARPTPPAISSAQSCSPSAAPSPACAKHDRRLDRVHAGEGAARRRRASGRRAPSARNASAVRSTFTPASSSRTATASGPNPLKIGTQIAPILEQAITAATVSGQHRQEDPDRVARLDARAGGAPAPGDRSAGGARRRSTSACRRPRPPRPPRARPGSLAAHRSTHWWARLTRPPPNHVAHSTPRETSRTCRYGSRNSMSRSRTTASQNQATSVDGAPDQLLVGLDPVRRA